MTASAAAPLTPSADGTLAGRNGDLAFWITDSGDSDEIGGYIVGLHVGLVSPNGRRRRFVAEGHDPTFSPDGRTLAIGANGPGIALHRLDGKRIRLVTRSNDYDPAWSPSGKRLAFSRLRCVDIPGGEDYDRRCRSNGIFTIGPKGRSRQLLVRNGLEPAWSRTGKIAFVAPTQPYELLGGTLSGTSPHEDPIRVISSGGGRSRQLVDSGFSPDWSPRGDRLAFIRRRGANAALFVVNADGRGLRRLHITGTYPGLASPVWAPDGRSIAFLEGHAAFTISPTGKKRRRLPRFPCDPCEIAADGADGLAWQPLP